MSYLNCSAREDISVKGEKRKKTPGSVVLAGSRLGRLSDALGIRDLGPEDDITAVRRKG